MILATLLLLKLLDERIIEVDNMTFSVGPSSNGATFIYSTEKNVIIPKEITYEDNRYTVNAIKMNQTTEIESIFIHYLIDSIKNLYYNKMLNNITLENGISKIGQGWFQNMESPFNISIPNSVASIENHAFANSSVSYVDFGTGLTYIYEYAFDSSKLVQILPRTNSNIKLISDFAFNNCIQLQDIKSILSNVQTINSYAFNGTILLNQKITLPDTFLNISEGTFAYSGINDIYLGENLTYIGKYAFYSCNSLKNTIKYPQTLSEIDDYAFSNTPISSIMPKTENNITKFGIGVFMNCSMLTDVLGMLTVAPAITDYMFANTNNIEQNIELPPSIRSIGQHSFENCQSIKTLGYTSYLHHIGDYAFAGSSIEEVTNIYYNDLATIGKCAFMNSKLKTFGEILNNMKVINEFTFANCSLLATSMNVGANTVEIQESAFMNSAITSANCRNAVTKIGKCAFQNCLRLSSISGSGSIVEITEDCCLNCINLKSFEFSDKTKKIFDRAFKNTSLSSIVIPSLEYLSTNAFREMRDCKLVDIGVPSYEFKYLGDFTNVTKLVLRVDDVKFSLNAFLRSNIQSLEITASNNVEIGNGAFRDSKLETLKINFDAKVTIGPYAFSHSLLKDVSCQITKAEDGAFGYTYLKTIPLITDAMGKFCFINTTIETAIIECESIGECAFKGCTKLKNIKFGKKVKSLSEDLFMNAEKIAKVEFEEGCQITEIPNFMFYNCTKLTEISDLPENLENIGIRSFAYTNIPCPDFSKLKRLKKISDSAFDKAISKGSLKLPSSLEKLCNGAFSDTKISGEIIFPESLKYIGSNCFATCYGITKIDFSKCSNLETIDSYAFFKCTKIENELILPKNIKMIGDFAFYNCPNMSGILLPVSLTEIGGSAFEYCLEFSGILTIPESVKTIGKRAFYGIAKITQIHFESKDVNVGDEAFAGMHFICMANLPANCSKLGLNESRCYESDNFGIWGTKLSENCNKLQEVKKIVIISVPVAASLIVILIIVILLICFCRKRNKQQIDMTEKLLQ